MIYEKTGQQFEVEIDKEGAFISYDGITRPMTEIEISLYANWQEAAWTATKYYWCLGGLSMVFFVVVLIMVARS